MNFAGETPGNTSSRTPVPAAVRLQKPWVIAWWSAAFPGFGYFLLGQKIKGTFFVIWEMVVNVQARLNLAILHSFTGHFDLARQVLNTRWILFYVPVYLFVILDSYRLAVNMHKTTVFSADPHCFRPPKPGLAGQDRRNPMWAAVWSLMMPGTGQLYNGSLYLGLFILVWWIAVGYIAGFLTAVHLTATGHLVQAAAVTNPEWLLFLPSFYLFGAYEAYVSSVAANSRCGYEQELFLRIYYQHPRFIMPF